MSSRFPFNEVSKQQSWGLQYGVDIECPICGEKRFIGRSQYLEKFRKGPKCKCCNKRMIPYFVCRKCKSRLSAELDGNEIIVKAMQKHSNESHPQPSQKLSQ